MTDEMAADKITVRSHDELIAVVPHTLGFTPAESMVCLAVAGGPTARVDLPGPTEDVERWAQDLAGFYLYQHRPSHLALFAYGKDSDRCLGTLEALRGALNGEGGQGPTIPAAVWVNGDEWVDVVNDVSGRVDPAATSRIDAEYAFRGQSMPLTAREDIAATMYGDTSGVAEHLSDAQALSLQADVRGAALEAHWFTERLNQFRRDRDYLGDDEVAQVLAVLHKTEVREAALAQMSCKESPVVSEFWHDVVRRAPGEVRDAPLSMLAFSRFLQGRGAEAWIALDQLQESDPLADLVNIALTNGVDPRGWDRRHEAPPNGSVLQQAVLQETSRPNPPGPAAGNPERPERGPEDPGPSAPSR